MAFLLELLGCLRSLPWFEEKEIEMKSKLQITRADQFLYGVTPHPVTCGRGVTVGGGSVVPEVNFTLPPIAINAQNWNTVLAHYQEMITDVLQRAVELDVEQLLIEFETLPEMTHTPEWGLEIVRLLADEMDRMHAKHGLRSALRFTPNDVREFARPPLMRRGEHWDAMQTIFAGSGKCGADLLSIESTGGKEICDDALINANLPQVLFALGVLGVRDMRFLWEHMASACRAQGIVPAGDTACGFGNTAMVLADQGMIPKVFAAVVRVATVPRSLEAYAAGAVGPSKDCAYEGPYMKAIAGVPISMEGKSASCAHMSHVGNVAQAVCDAWSNESVQNVQLLSGKAPVVSLEQLAYDCRLMNTAAKTARGASQLSNWLAESDAPLNVQAYVLHPNVVLRLSETIMSQSDRYQQTLTAASATIQEIKDAIKDGRVRVSKREVPWLDRMAEAVGDMPDTEEKLIEEMLADPEVRDRFHPEEYGIGS